MNKEEFTEGFDLERFKAGEPAINDDGFLLSFNFMRNKITMLGFATNHLEGKKWNWSIDITVYENFHKWRMKPRDDGWIKHDGGECPIPWAKNGDFVVKLKCGEIISAFQSDADAAYIWEPIYAESDVIAWRLTDRWLPVLNGKCPLDREKHRAALVDIKWCGGAIWLDRKTQLQDVPECGWTNGSILAIRLVDQAQKTIQIETDSCTCTFEPINCTESIAIDFVVRQNRPALTLAEIRARKPRPAPIRSILRDIEGIVAEVRDEKRERGAVVECEVVAKLMR